MLLALLSDRKPPTLTMRATHQRGGCGEADKLKRMLPRVWFEQDVDDVDAGGDGDAAERSEELVHRAKLRRIAGYLS
jgi:hypothetical protein